MNNKQLNVGQNLFQEANPEVIHEKQMHPRVCYSLIIGPFLFDEAGSALTMNGEGNMNTQFGSIRRS